MYGATARRNLPRRASPPVAVTEQDRDSVVRSSGVQLRRATRHGSGRPVATAPGSLPAGNRTGAESAVAIAGEHGDRIGLPQGNVEGRGGRRDSCRQPRCSASHAQQFNRPPVVEVAAAAAEQHGDRVSQRTSHGQVSNRVRVPVAGHEPVGRSPDGDAASVGESSGPVIEQDGELLEHGHACAMSASPSESKSAMQLPRLRPAMAVDIVSAKMPEPPRPRR